MAPEVLAAAIVGATLTIYALLGGADFGAGIWELNAGFRLSKAENRLIQRAMGPVWEANHVWLIFALVVTHTAFPAAYGGVARALWLPLLLALVGIVFRGAAFVFRAYGDGAPATQTAWGIVFAFASTAAPLFFGAAIGSLATGGLAIGADGAFAGDHLTDWITPLGIFTAFFAVCTCAHLAAVYLTREAAISEDPEVVDAWRRRALVTGMWMGLLATAGLAFVATEAPHLWSGLEGLQGTLVAVSVASGLGSLWALWSRRFNAALAGAASAVAAVIWGWLTAQLPVIVPPAITIENAKAPDNVLWLAIGGAAAGGVLLLPALGFLFWMFKRQQRSAPSGGGT